MNQKIKQVYLYLLDNEQINLRLLGLIITLGFVLRVAFLNISPPGFNADEAALGYNAYSLLKTGKDEWGESWPIVFKSFSDYKPGLYVYLDLPFIVLFGLNELSIRLPSIILGIVSIYLTYLLSKEIFKKETIAISTAFLLSVSPWHIHFSRGAWETNIATFSILLGVLSFLKALRSPKWYVFSGISFVASIYAYQSTRLIIPVLLIGIFILYFRKVKFKAAIPGLIVSAILLIPLVLILLSDRGLARFQGVSIFSDIGPINRLNEERGEHQDPNSLVSKLYHNKLLEYGYVFTKNYFDHFSPQFLFIEGDPLKRNKIPETGQLYLFEIITLMTGLFILARRQFSNVRIIILWLVVAPIAAAMTYQSPHALRAHNMVIPLMLISGLGMGAIYEHFQKFRFKFRLTFNALAMLVIFYFFSLYIHQYYVHLPKQYALEWEYGFSKLVSYLVSHQESKETIFITDRYDQPYILVLFYTKYNPKTYQNSRKEIGDNNFGFSTIRSFDKYKFKKIEDKDLDNINDAYVVASGEEIARVTSPEKIIDFPNGNPAFKIYSR